jgi:hypothetical protein
MPCTLHSRNRAGQSWIKSGHDECVCIDVSIPDTPLPPRDAKGARAMRNPRSLEMRGRRESRASDAPAALRAKIKSTQASHHRFTGSIRPSLRNGFNGFLRALPGDRAFLSPSPATMRKHHRQLDASVGASGPHDFAVRGFARSSSALTSSIASRANVRDDRDTPLFVGAEWREVLKVICPSGQGECFGGS